MAGLLYVVFFMSGMGALLFETLWFRLAGLALGNSVWAATVVLSAFMAGLSIGNAFAVRYGERIRRPIRAYACVETIIGVSGLMLIFVFPSLTKWLAPLFQPLLDNSTLLNAVRLLLAFALMLIPASAMGATLPLMVKALYTGSASYGSILGRLYGWNTLGAVAGALIGDVFLIRSVGVRGTGFAAASMSVMAALGALAVRSSFLKERAVPASYDGSPNTPFMSLFMGNKRLLFASFISGGIFLALEVIWFRFLILFFPSRTLIFSIMLAIVLAGIGIGSLLASRWLKRNPDAYVFVAPILLLCGVMVAVLYASFHHILTAPLPAVFYAKYVLPCLYLMFPVSALSGISFTFIGSSLHHNVRSETGTTGMLALFNTVGATLGSGLAGFLLIPRLGMELSLFFMALAYGGVALLTLRSWRPSSYGIEKYPISIGAFLFVFSLFVFPFNVMGDTYLKYARQESIEKDPSLNVIAVREGITETVQYLRSNVFGAPYYYRLITNNHKMAANNVAARRYMKMYVYLPVALNPEAKNALLISYGVGSTAKAMTDTRSLESIDIVDISQDIIDLSSVIFPESKDNPVNDPRVKVHIEDGRFFLLTTFSRYDLITSEPPPPKHAGIVNLYSQEYFQLIHDRLNDGGIVTYWLPVRQLMDVESKAVLKAFCNVFDDCSLWSGASLELMMVGTRKRTRRVTEHDFSRQWNDPIVKPEIEALGIETPLQMATLFLADTPQLQEITKDSLPVTDNFPMRLDTNYLDQVDAAQHVFWKHALMRTDTFIDSIFIHRLWPKRLITQSRKYIEPQRVLNALFDSPFTIDLKVIHAILTTTSLKNAVLWSLNIDADILRNAEKAATRGLEDRRTIYCKAVRALSQRNYALAEKHLSAYVQTVSGQEKEKISILRAYISLMRGDKESAQKIAREWTGQAMSRAVYGDPTWAWLEKTFKADL